MSRLTAVAILCLLDAVIWQNIYLDANTSGKLRTNLAIDPSEFQVFRIAQPSNVTFCIKELRAILSFCDFISVVCYIAH